MAALDILLTPSDGVMRFDRTDDFPVQMRSACLDQRPEPERTAQLDEPRSVDCWRYLTNIFYPRRCGLMS